MITASTFLLLAGQIALHVEDTRGVTDEDRDAVVGVLGEAIAAVAGTKPVLAKREACPSADRCTEAIRVDLGAKEVVHLRMIGVPSRIRVLAERAGTGSEPPRSAQADLTRDAASWRSSLDGLALVLFPNEKRASAKPEEKTPEIAKVEVAPPPPPVVPPEEPVEEKPNLVPWIAIGGGALALGVGTIFGIKSNNARTEGMTMEHSKPEIDDLQDELYNSALAANILFGLAAVGVATGTYLLLRE
jgi:hypothetical protein